MTNSTSEGKSLLKRMESDIIKVIIGSVSAVIIAGVTFYFNTSASLAAHGDKIQNLEHKITGVEEKISKISTDPVISAEQIKAIKEMMVEVIDRQKRTEQRQDKMYDIILELAKKSK